MMVAWRARDLAFQHLARRSGRCLPFSNHKAPCLSEVIGTIASVSMDMWLLCAAHVPGSSGEQGRHGFGPSSVHS